MSYVRTTGLFVLATAFVLLAVSKSSEAQNVDFLKIAETCSANFITQDYRDNWEDKTSFDEWRIRMTSKLHIYLLAQSMYGTDHFRSFTEKTWEKSCLLTTRINGWGISNTTGFGGKHIPMRLVRTNLPKVYRFTMPFSAFSAQQGTASVILSDNSDYTVFEYCFDNGLRTFAVYTQGPLDVSQRDAIKLHLKAIGYNEKHFVDLYPQDACTESGEKGVLEPNTPGDLPEPGSRSFNYGRALLIPNALYPAPPLFWKKK